MLTRKRSIVFMLILVLVLAMMSACGNQKDNTASEKEPKTEENATKTFTMANGKKVEIPAHPKRVVMPYEFLGNALALGVKPVGVTQAVMENPYIKEQAKGIENVGNPISLEKVVELNPDLIIVYLEDQYKQLSKIAPTVFIPFGHYKNIQEEMRVFGELFGKQKEAEQWIQQFDKKAAAAREKIKGVIGENETVGIYKLQGKDFYAIGDNFGHAGQIIYNALQLTPPEKIKQEVIQGPQWKLISLEALPDYAADHMFWTVYKMDGTEQAEKELKNSAIWKNLNAVKNHHVYEMKIEDIWFSDAISLEHQLDLVVDTLLSANQK
ncbi:iron-hydroxamate ABC transporter substrate-binding protein [Geobacillus sp. NFOSA3]|uniref:Periplasmic binding protein n=1 Tax=Geobacillus sp. (strain WCH70) TaxID=471223 RepID=C5D2Q8_GEOSW|nr:MULTISPECIES: iron-hydroxamate ABC transporter substrate-binding protein [Bacillaceae]NNU92960.1 iron-hydroxamate ABC transporter substrate-binding protein [Geobacillus sp. NFOSA3]OQP01214.1 iron ABC transporter substrate-binding protein [Geobacillus sp. 44C]PDM40918.1 iron ABC transporter substrate-binding protein [Parageobacillus yumthangensis]MED4988038.1 iron-hydroxamate ABC transporter substrate-binding protein [Parageobacillus toebii]PUF89491.1 iron ABC transporter substrate-binding p